MTTEACTVPECQFGRRVDPNYCHLEYGLANPPAVNPIPGTNETTDIINRCGACPRRKSLRQRYPKEFRQAGK